MKGRGLDYVIPCCVLFRVEDIVCNRSHMKDLHVIDPRNVKKSRFYLFRFFDYQMNYYEELKQVLWCTI